MKAEMTFRHSTIKMKNSHINQLAFFLVILALGFASVTQSKADTLHVAVAANVQFAFDELKAEFKTQTGHELKAVFNSSGRFVSQILNGAPFDVFMSADMEYPNVLFQRAHSVEAPKVYAYGTLVLWSRKHTDLQDWRNLLQSEKIKKIAIPNPKTAPYGRAAMEVLQKLKLVQIVTPRLVFAESVSQTNQYIYSNVVDLGFTAKSVVISKEMRGQGTWIALPDDAYVPIAQGVVILKHGRENSPRLSRQFYDFLSTPIAKAILQKNGYITP